MKLYFAPGACSLAVRIAVAEAGLGCAFERVDLGTKITSAGENFYTVNGKGKVATLVLETGQIVTENSAILQYIADQVPAGQLLPGAGSAERYEALSWIGFVTSEIHKAGVHPLANPVAPPEMKAFSKDYVMVQLEFVDRTLQAREFVAGPFSVADCYMFWALGLMRRFEIEAAFTDALNRYVETLSQRPAFEASLKAEAALATWSAT